MLYGSINHVFINDNFLEFTCLMVQTMPLSMIIFMSLSA